MKIATIRTSEGTSVARVDGDTVISIEGYPDLGALLRDPDWHDVAASAADEHRPAAGAEFAQLVADPSKILCAGLNYRSHILEMGRELPTHPTLFAKYTETLTGPYDDIEFTPQDPEMDWEGELAVVIGRVARRVPEEKAGQYIAGYSIANDISMRGWQSRTHEWLQGKIWEASTPLGPVMITADEFDRESARLTTTVNEQVMQDHSTADLVFTPAHLVHHISQMITLRPGDIILTGTPGGVGRAREPQVYLTCGDIVSVSIDGIGSISSLIVEPV